MAFTILDFTDDSLGEYSFYVKDNPYDINSDRVFEPKQPGDVVYLGIGWDCMIALKKEDLEHLEQAIKRYKEEN